MSFKGRASLFILFYIHKPLCLLCWPYDTQKLHVRKIYLIFTCTFQMFFSANLGEYSIHGAYMRYETFFSKNMVKGHMPQLSFDMFLHQYSIHQLTTSLKFCFHWHSGWRTIMLSIMGWSKTMIHLWKSRWNPTRKMKVIFRFHVIFPGCIKWKHQSNLACSMSEFDFISYRIHVW